MQITTPVVRRLVCLPMVIFSICVSVSDCLADSAGAPSINLQLAIKKTLEQNPQLYQFELLRQKLLAQRKKNGLSPPLVVELELEKLANSDNSNVIESAESTLALSSVIELGGARQARLNITDSKISVTHIQQQSKTLDVLAELTSTYIQGLAIQALLDVAHNEVSLAKQLYQSIEDRVKRGAASEAEMLAVKASVVQAELYVNELRQQYQRNKMQLARFWGERKPNFFKLQGSLFEMEVLPTYESLYARAVRSPAVEIFASEVRLNNAEIRLAKATNQSDLTWRLGVQHFEETGATALTGSLSLPLFSKKRNSGNIDALLAERESIETHQKNTLVQLNLKLYQAYSLAQQNMAAIESIGKELIPTLEKSRQLVQQSYLQGRDQYRDLFVIQQQLLAAKRLKIKSAKAALLNLNFIEQITADSLNR